MEAIFDGPMGLLQLEETRSIRLLSRQIEGIPPINSEFSSDSMAGSDIALPNHQEPFRSVRERVLGEQMSRASRLVEHCSSIVLAVFSR